MSLYEKLLDLEKKDSSYYYDNIKYKKPITHPQNAWSFIKEYFEAKKRKCFKRR